MRVGIEDRRSGKGEAGGARSDACCFLIVTVDIVAINTGMMIALTDQARTLDVLQWAFSIYQEIPEIPVGL